MKIKLVDGIIYLVSRAEIVNNRLEIDFTDKTAEEVQNIFSAQGNLTEIKLLTDVGEEFGMLPGFTVYGGTILNKEIKTALLIKESDKTAQRITQAETSALAAMAKANEGAQEITATQLALCEVYELIGGMTNV